MIGEHLWSGSWHLVLGQQSLGSVEEENLKA